MYLINVIYSLFAVRYNFLLLLITIKLEL